MLRLKQNKAYGIDKEIIKLNERMHEQIINFVNTNNYDAFYRCHENNTPDSDELIIEAFDSDNNNYVDVMTNSQKALISYFVKGQQSTTDDGYNFANNTLLFFVANLKAMNMTDEELQSKIVTIINNLHSVTGVTISGLNVGEQILEGYKYKRKYNNMDPYHIFNIELEVFYNLNKC